MAGKVKSHMVTVRLNKTMKDRLRAAADVSGRSLSGEIQHRLAQFAFNKRVIDAFIKGYRGWAPDR